jgi:16S rRNA (guanine1207-N2)-methyltransferase
MEHYYSENPSSELKIRNAEIELKSGHKYSFRTPSGVFSFGKVDKASAIMLNYMNYDGGSTLDIGCGYGLIGITIKREYPEKQVFMSDINKRAVEFAKINTKDYGIEIDIRPGNLYEPWENMKFDSIVSNPPIVAGKHVWQEIVDKAPEFLSNNGSLQIVAFHNKGGCRIRDYMNDKFGNVQELCKKGGIRVYRSVKK